MSTILTTPRPPEIEYPESDGEPIAENTLQFQWIVMIEGGLDAMFGADPNVFVAGDLFWYPVEGNPKIRLAPDTLVVFGRPKGHRGSYMQWREGNVAPQVVFEVRSPGNRFGELLRKFEFYQRYGVEEYYLYDPDFNELEGWLRSGANLQPIPSMNDWTSPRLGIRFSLERDTLVVYRPDGGRFLTYCEVEQERQTAQRQAEAAQKQAEAAQKQAEAAQRLADDERHLRLAAEAKIEQEKLHREIVEAKLRELGIDPARDNDSWDIC